MADGWTRNLAGRMVSLHAGTGADIKRVADTGTSETQGDFSLNHSFFFYFYAFQTEEMWSLEREDLDLRSNSVSTMAKCIRWWVIVKVITFFVQ